MAERTRSDSKPRGLAAHLAKVAGGQSTARLSDLTEVGPESNVPEGAVVVESTRLSPGSDGPAVVAVPGEIAEHTDSDSRLTADGELRKVEPVEPAVAPEGKPAPDRPSEGPRQGAPARGVEGSATPPPAPPRKGKPGA